MIKEKKNLISLLVIVVLAVALVIMAIGFANYTRDLSINGTANLTAASWDVHFDDTSYSATRGSVSVTPNIGTTTMSYTVDLEKPGDFYEFTINVVNGGTYDAKLNTIALTPVDSAYQKYLTYEVYYEGTKYTAASNDVSSSNIVLTAGSTSANNSDVVKVKVTYINPASDTDLLAEDLSNLTLSTTLSYEQVPK